MARYFFSMICLIVASIALGYGSLGVCDEMPLIAVADSSTPPIDDSAENISPGGAMPFDEDDFTGFESGECAGTSATADVPCAREGTEPSAAAACGLGSAPGFAKLRERPPRRTRS